MSHTALKIVGSTALVGGVGAIAYGWLFGDYRKLKQIAPDTDAPPIPGKTGYKLVDKLLPKLQSIAQSTGIPLGLLIAWIAKESGGKLADHTSLDERGYFQLMPEESKSLNLDHQRLSTDSDYSLDAGVKLIRKYMSTVNALDVQTAPAGSAFYWMLVKLAHTVGSGQTKKWVKAAQAANKCGSWDEFAAFVLGEHWTGPQPKKWIPFLASIYKLGAPFGFGAGAAPALVGAQLIIEPGAEPPSRGWRSIGLFGIDVFAA